nr:hypothetical protein Iba_chr14dCG12630 [Ipomoea batatas]
MIAESELDLVSRASRSCVAFSRWCKRSVSSRSWTLGEVRSTKFCRSAKVMHGSGSKVRNTANCSSRAGRHGFIIPSGLSAQKGVQDADLQWDDYLRTMVTFREGWIWNDTDLFLLFGSGGVFGSCVVIVSLDSPENSRHAAEFSIEGRKVCLRLAVAACHSRAARDLELLLALCPFDL